MHATEKKKKKTESRSPLSNDHRHFMQRSDAEKKKKLTVFAVFCFPSFRF